MAQVPPLPFGPAAGGLPGSLPDKLAVETTVDQERAISQPGVKADELAAAPELGFWKLAVIRFLHPRLTRTVAEFAESMRARASVMRPLYSLL